MEGERSGHIYIHNNITLHSTALESPWGMGASGCLYECVSKIEANPILGGGGGGVTVGSSKTLHL